VLIQLVENTIEYGWKMENSGNTDLLLSIITPSYNQGRYIRDTIHSVLDQSYKNFEYLVIDGASEDETTAILAEFKDRLRYVSEKDDGQAQAVNKGIRMSRGDIIGWLNSDDIYAADSLAAVAGYFRKNPECKILYGEAWHIDASGKFIDRYPTQPFVYPELAYGCYICQPSVFFRREIVEQVGYLDESLDLCMDYDYWIRVGKKYQLHYLNKVIACSRMYQENKTMSRAREAAAEAGAMIKRHFGYLPLNWIVAVIALDNPDYRFFHRWLKAVVILIQENKANPRRIWQEISRAIGRRLSLTKQL